MPQLVTIPAPESGQTRITFTSSEVGNGNPNDSGTQANQDGALAVRVQAEAEDGTLTGLPERYTDEDIVFVSASDSEDGVNGTFDVRDLVSGVQRGNQFVSVQLGTQGDDRLSSFFGNRSAYINGGQGEDDITGSTVNDFLVGGAGDDILDGSLGNDGLLGGAGSDIAVLDASLGGSDTIDLGTGNDAVAVTRTTAGQIRLTFTSAEVGNGNPNDSGTLANQDGGLAVRIQAENDAGELEGAVSRSDDEGITFFGGDGVTFDVRDLVSGVQRGDQFATATLGTAARDVIEGTNEADYINGGGGDDRLRGFEGNDFLVGGAGNDTLEGGSGANGLLGGAGNDIYGVENSRDRVIEAVGGGFDRVFATTSYTLAEGQEIEQLQLLQSTGTAALDIKGNAFDQALVGNGGNNVLDGRGGDDLMTGGRGDDVYGVDSAGDQVIERPGAGFDRVYSVSSYTLAQGQEIELLQLLQSTGTAALEIKGNEFDQTLVGNGGNNVLDGRGGDDVMIGGRGDDIYGVDSAGDQVIERAGAGFDRVYSTSSFALAEGQEIELLFLLRSTGTANLNLTGNAFGQILSGNAGDNVLDGRGGSDILVSGFGADTFVFSTAIGNGDVDLLADFSSADTIRLSAEIFTALSPGALSADAFKDVGAGGTVDASDRILYDSRTGALSYDADGSGSGAAVQFASLDNRAALNAGDFVVV